VVGEQAPEMTWTEDDDVIEKLSSAGSHPTLGDRVPLSPPDSEEGL
jgi:hypothetical protein